MFSKLKKELFYIKETVRYGYGPASLLNYLKNKIFARQIAKKIPKWKCEKQDDFEVHMLCQKSDVVTATWSLWSFLKNSQLCPKIVIHDDGSLDDESVAIFKNKFDNLEVIWRKDADRLINKINVSPIIKDYREKGYPLILKLVDILLLSRSEKVMVLDSDVLFFKKPEEIVRFVKGDSGRDALISQASGGFVVRVDDNYLKKYNLAQKNVELMNSGIVVYNKSSISEVKLSEYFENCKLDISDYFVEMTGWNCLIGQTNCEFLPLDRYIIKGRAGPNTVAKHFTGPRRHEMFAYGIDKVRC
ncbi:MAG: hypothetical protein HYT63_01295 [Candidatus Yanofskybacteria bacterium]|nr:hypothetical protein [Candidatus Yanofskybacteria bacterium]